jgi:hypothetical protein
MSRIAKQGWQSLKKTVPSTPDRPESQPRALSDRPYLQSNKTIWSPGGVMFDIRRLDDSAAFERRPILSSITHCVAKLVSTLL